MTRDGWQDILLVNGMDWPGHKRTRSTLRLYRNNRNGTFTDVTRKRRVWISRCTAWESQSAIITMTAFLTFCSPRRPEPAIPKHREGHFIDVTRPAAWVDGKASALPRCGSISIATASSICLFAIM